MHKNSASAPVVPDKSFDISLKAKYLLKALRADELWYTDAFFRMITPSANRQEQLAVRPYSKKAFTVTANGVFKRADKNPLYTKEEKATFSKHCSTTLFTDNIFPPVFGHTRERRNRLVGVMIDLKDALINRRFIYDGGTVTRPYDFDNEEDAKRYFETKVNGPKPMLFADQEGFEKAIADRKDGQMPMHNEVLARLRWNLDGSSKIFIGSDTLEARLLAIEYARILLNRLRQQAAENGTVWNPNYSIPICFYLPEAPYKHLAPYDFDQQREAICYAHDIHECYSIGGDLTRHGYYNAMRYEFLLVLRTPITILREKTFGLCLVQKILHDGYVHIVQNLLERAIHPDILAQVPLDADALTTRIFYYVAQAGNVQLMQWLLTKRATAKTPVKLESDEYPTLVAACLRGHAKIVELLLAAGADRYQREIAIAHGRLPILIAAETKRWDIVKIFLAHASAPNAAPPTPEEEEHYCTVLTLAIAKLTIIDVDVIMALVKLGAYRGYYYLKIKDNNLLHWAIKENNPALLRSLVLSNAGFNYADLVDTNDKGQTPIEFAAANQQWDLVEIIIGENPCASPVSARKVVLLEAVKHNKLNIVTVLATYTSIHLVCPITGYNLLGLAVKHGYVTLTKFLLESGADPDHKGADNNSVFDLVKQRAQHTQTQSKTTTADEIIQLFENYQQDGNNKFFNTGCNYRRSLLRKAIEQNNLPEVIRLYDDTISPDWVIPDYLGGTLLHWAILSKAVDVVTFLLTKNPDLLKTNRSNLTPISLAACSFLWPIVEVIGKYTRNGCDYSGINGAALNVAVISGELKTVKTLAEAGAATNKALFRAIYKADVDMIMLFLQHNTDLEWKEENRTAIEYATYLKQWSIVETIAEYKKTDHEDKARYNQALSAAIFCNSRAAIIALIKANADVNHSDDNGDTILHWAIEQQDDELVKLLLTSGADVTRGNKVGRTPIELACQKNQLALVKLIIKHSANECRWKSALQGSF